MSWVLFRHSLLVINIRLAMIVMMMIVRMMMILTRMMMMMTRRRNVIFFWRIDTGHRHIDSAVRLVRLAKSGLLAFFPIALASSLRRFHSRSFSFPSFSFFLSSSHFFSAAASA